MRQGNETKGRGLLERRFDEVIDGGTNDIEAAALRFLEHLDD